MQGWLQKLLKSFWGQRTFIDVEVLLIKPGNYISLFLIFAALPTGTKLFFIVLLTWTNTIVILN